METPPSGAVPRSTPSPDSGTSVGATAAVTADAASNPEETPPELAAVRPGEQLDWDALRAWLAPRLADALPDVTGPLEILQFPNGSANLTYLLRVGAHE